MKEEIITKGLEVWSIMSAIYIMLLSLFVGVFLHLSKAYFKNMLAKFEIKMGRDNFGVIYYALRDGALFLSFVIGILLINPDMMSDVKIAVPFMPYGTIFLGFALVVYLKTDIEGNLGYKRLFMFFLLMAVLLQYVGFTFVMEAKPHEWIKDSGSFWLMFRNMRSNLNPSLSMFTFYTSFPFVILIVLAIFLFPSRNGVKVR